MSRALDIAMVRCAHCGKIDATTRSICSNCLSSELLPHDVPGTGKLVSWTMIRRAPTRFRDDAPYQVCVIDLDSGQRVTGRLDSAEEIQAGARVVAVETAGAAPIFQPIAASFIQNHG